jgi:TolA-binding protein
VVLLLALIGGAVYVLRTPNPTIAPPAPAASATPDNSAALETRYQQARRQLIEGKYEAAETSFRQLAIDAQDRQPLLNWSRFHAGVAALLQGKTAPAREAFQQVATTARRASSRSFSPKAAGSSPLRSPLQLTR